MIYGFADFASATVRCRIYQADFDQVLDLMFSKPPAGGGPRYVPAHKYARVFDGDVKAKNLEDIFAIFNVRHPAGYTGRSLTTTDVVEIDDGWQHEFYFCESSDFSKAIFDVREIRQKFGGDAL